jgi:hypothetical protein
MANVRRQKLNEKDREWFIINNQKAFKYGATEEFGVRDEHFEEGDEIISRETIEKSIDGGIAYVIMSDDEKLYPQIKKCGKMGLKVDRQSHFCLDISLKKFVC